MAGMEIFSIALLNIFQVTAVIGNVRRERNYEAKTVEREGWWWVSSQVSILGKNYRQARHVKPS